MGLRPGVVLDFQWDDIEEAAERLTVKQAIRRAGGDLFVLGDPKTTSSTRTLGMPTLVADALQRHRVRQMEERMAAGPAWKETGTVFTTVWGGMINPSTSRGAFSRLTRYACLGHWRPHELRHSMVSILSHRGGPLEQITDLAGHSPGSRLSGIARAGELRPLRRDLTPLRFPSTLSHHPGNEGDNRRRPSQER